ncbi:hypothetical protein [Aquimarina agarilytica]|uniref:hypothetical protein n=1 Tax=Aquimarina agarilytica TaxID=1087449 RepID=UPI0002EC217B|nr:hypothetical protein [Aquimarina agarilytica]
MSLIISLLVITGIVWFLKINTADNKARKDAIQVEASIEKVNCKQRLKGDKSLVAVAYKGQVYYIFFKNEKDCNKYKENQKVTAYFSKTYNKLYLDL